MERLPLVRVDGQARQLPAGDHVHLGSKVRLLTAVQYAALSPPDAGTMYIISDGPAVYYGSSLVWAPLAPAVPENTSPPTVSGAAHVGDTATATSGSWTNSPTSYAYQWQVEPGTGWEDILGETGSTFGPIEEIGEYRVQVIATNGDGASDPAYSEPFVVTEAGGVPAYVNSANTGNTYYNAVSPTSVTLNGVAAGNTLVLVITGVNDLPAGVGSLEPASLSNPAGASWGAAVLSRSQAAFSDDRSGLAIYVAHGVLAGNHTITATWQQANGGYVGMTLIELENVSEVVASGSAGANGDPSKPTDMSATTGANVPAGIAVAIGAAARGRDWDAGLPITGDGGYTQRHAGGDTYAEGRVESAVVDFPGGAPTTWTATLPGGSQSSTQGWASGVVVLQ